jgi:YidC/Oxa1 family membrane protein insertase
MNDIRRTILWVIFGFSMVLLWDKWQLHNGNKATFFPSPAAKTIACHAVIPQARDRSRRHTRGGSVPACAA